MTRAAGPEYSSYQGEWSRNKRNGRGVAVLYPSGEVYEGPFETDIRKGECTYTWPDGGVFQGTYPSSSKCPVDGDMVRCAWYKDGLYTGAVRGGLRHGHGLFEWESGDPYEGQWKQDRRDGLGLHTADTSEGHFEYEGGWTANRRHGPGTQRYANGDVYDGQWKEDKREGEA